MCSVSVYVRVTACAYFGPSEKRRAVTLRVGQVQEALLVNSKERP